MDCIKYINDLQLEIEILENLKDNSNNEDIENKIKAKKAILKKCKENLEKLSFNQIYYKLYLYILNGLTPSQAVDKVAEDNYLNDVKPTAPSNIWKYYTKMKKILKQE